MCQLNSTVLFTKFSYLIQAPSLKRPLEIGKLDDGLYRLVQSSSLQSVDHCKSHSPLTVGSVSTSHCSYHSESNKMEISRHNRLGHIPFVRMKDMSSIPCTFSTKQPFLCPICPLARQSRLPFPDSSIKTTHPFQLIHVDTWGPYATPIHNGCRYFLTIVDDFTRATWTHLMGSKSNAFPLIKAFIAMIKTQFQSMVQTIRSDNAFELGSSSCGSNFFAENGILHQTSCSHTPQQNGVVERKHRYLLETSRALLFHSQLPIRFWGDCVLSATYLINRFPSKILHNKSSFELLFGQLPSYNLLKTFGCLCFASVPK